MILGNRTATPRAIFAGGSYVEIPPMGMATLDDSLKDEIVSAIQPLIDSGVFVLNMRIKENERPFEPAGPKPPVELEAEPENPRINAPKPKKTNEKMKI